MNKIHFDLTGLYHHRSETPNAITRIEEMVARHISINKNNDFNLVSWNSSTNNYIDIAMNINCPNEPLSSLFLNKNDIIFNTKDVIKYIGRKLIEWKFFGGVLNRFFKLVNARSYSEKIIYYRANKCKSFKSYLELKQRPNTKIAEINSGDKLIILNQAFTSNNDYLFHIIKMSLSLKIKFSFFLYAPLISKTELDKNSLKRLAIIFCLKNDIEIICGSEFVKNEIDNFIRESSIRYIHQVKKVDVPLNYLNIEEKKDHLDQKSKRKPYALSVGLQTSRKNHLFLIRLWKLLWDDNIDYLPDLIIIGNEADATQSIIRYIKNLDVKLQNKIYIYKNIGDNDLFNLYKNCEFTLYPSSFDPMALPVLESQYFNKRCICNTGSGIDFVANEISKTIPISDVQGWIECICTFSKNPVTNIPVLISKIDLSVSEFISSLISIPDRVNFINTQENIIIEKTHKPVNIVLADRSWILEELANKLGSNLDYVNVSDNPDPEALINYYINYSAFKKKTPNIDIAFFTHVEEFSKAAKDRFFEVANDVDISICMSHRYESIIKNKNSGKRVITITPGVDYNHFKPLLKVGISGRTYPSGRKGEKLIEKIFNEPWIEWHFTGDGWPKEGYKLNYSEMPDFYRSLDVLLIPSLYEGGPMPLLEALSCGIRVVSSDVGFVNEFPHIEFINGDHISMRNALFSIYNEKLVLRESVLNFSWEKWAEAHNTLFKQLLTK